MQRNRLFIVLVALALSVATAACGGRQREAVGGEDILLGDGPSMMGELEERARGFLLDMAFVIEANVDDPERAVQRFQALLAVNGDAMRENADALAARFAEMDGPERRLYEAQLAAYLGEANESWRHWSNTFHGRHPNAANEVLALVSSFDR